MERLKGFLSNYRFNKRTVAQTALRVLTGLLLLGGGAIIAAADRHTGVSLYMQEALGEFLFQMFQIWMMISGIILIFFWRISTTLFFILTLPFLIFVGYAVDGWRLGRWGFTGVFAFIILYLKFLIHYWGYYDDR
jgi:hypothetical protein